MRLVWKLGAMLTVAVVVQCVVMNCSETAAELDFKIRLKLAMWFSIGKDDPEMVLALHNIVANDHPEAGPLTTLKVPNIRMLPPDDEPTPPADLVAVASFHEPSPAGW